VGTGSSSTVSEPVQPQRNHDETASGRIGDGIPTIFNLAQNFPNPFNPTTSIQFGLPAPGHVTLKIYNVIGQEVATLADEDLSEGTYSRVWNASGMPSGVYIYRLTAGSFTETKKLQLLK